MKGRVLFIVIEMRRSLGEDTKRLVLRLEKNARWLFSPPSKYRRWLGLWRDPVEGRLKSAPPSLLSAFGA